jgi:NitT/TauT family transport system permease protein
MKNQQSHHIRHYHRHMSISYPASLRQRIYTFLVIPGLLLVLVYVVISKFGLRGVSAQQHVTWGFFISALLVTFTRILIAYAFALFFSLPLALMINHSPKAERILLPMFDIIQSVPVLAFFPVIILFFVHYSLYNGAAIFILIITMMWSIVFSVVGGLRGIPSDIKDAAKVFGLRGWKYVDRILLPAVVPYIVTGSLLAWAGGWNIIIVAEVLHTYIPGATNSVDLFGIGSVLVATAASGQQGNFFMALLVLIAFVGLLNFFVWQKLLKYAERFKFE